MKYGHICCGDKIRLKDIDANDVDGLTKKEARKACEKNTKAIDALSYCLDAEATRSVLIVLQGMDAAGKDGSIRHFIHAINPQSVDVVSFKQPTPEELAHDFLWRVHQRTPRHGRMAIFNRSHYEDVLVVKVHGLNGTQKWKNRHWARRYEQINEFEENLFASGTTIIKIFLHIDKEEQRKRLQERIDDPTRRWKISPFDLKERELWGDYQTAYEQMLTHHRVRTLAYRSSQ